MKLVVMITLLLSDADVLLTFASIIPYAQNGFPVGPVFLSVFSAVYLAGAYYGNEQKNKFCKMLRELVKEGQFVKRNQQPLTLDDVRGLTEDDFRRIMIQEGLGSKYYQARAKFIRNMVKWKHSLPFFRLAKFGWMVDIPAGDFAGILNSNALYSFTIGFPQMALGTAFWQIVLQGQIDFIVGASLIVSVMSLLLSIMNILIAFPKVLNELEEERQNLFEVEREVESKTRMHIEGLRRKRDEELRAVEGDPNSTELFLQIIGRSQDEEKKVRDGVRAIISGNSGEKPDDRV